MKKFLILISLIFLAQPVFSTELSCKQAAKMNKPLVALYTADYCTYCRRFKPIYDELSKELSTKYNFVKIDVTSKSRNGLCDNVNLHAIPTVYLFDLKTGKRQQVSTYLLSNKTALRSYIEKYYSIQN